MHQARTAPSVQQCPVWKCVRVCEISDQLTCWTDHMVWQGQDNQYWTNLVVSPLPLHHAILTRLMNVGLQAVHSTTHQWIHALQHGRLRIGH